MEEMNFYDVMQLSAADTKQLLRETPVKKEKRMYQLAFVVKNVLCILFCMTVVVSFSPFYSEKKTVFRAWWC